jgi:hypothetical protein
MDVLQDQNHNDFPQAATWLPRSSRIKYYKELLLVWAVIVKDDVYCTKGYRCMKLPLRISSILPPLHHASLSMACSGKEQEDQATRATSKNKACNENGASS